jgi:pimeloyl-ACP methyl ester carboxylesterase
VNSPRQPVVAAVAALALVLPSLVADAYGQPEIFEPAVPRFEAAACRFPAPADMPSGGTLRCGYLVVLEERSAAVTAANISTLRLAVAVVSSGHPAVDPVVYLAGGPGGAGSSDLAALVGGPAQTLLGDRDWIFLDQRGTGFSEPSLACPEVHASGAGATDPVEFQHAEDCATRLSSAGIDVSAYTTANSAADVADLVSALGYDQVNLYGASYGSRLALAVERDFPEVLRSVILDGVLPPQASGYANAPISVSRSLRLVFDACAADARCSAAYPDPLGQFGHVMSRLHTQPVAVEYPDPTSHQTRHVLLDSKVFMQIVYVLLYVREGLAMLPALIGITDGGDFGPATSFLPDVDAYASAVSLGLYYSVECAEEGQRLGIPNLLIGELPGVREELGFSDELARFCSVWPARPAPDGASAPVVSDVPTLLLSGRFDPVTPPDYARATAIGLSHSYQVEFPIDSHVALSTGACSIGIARAFLATPDQQPPSSCTSEGSLSFVLP